MQNTYVNNVTVNNVTTINNVTYINQTNGVTAMRREDMSSGRPAAQVAVRVDPRQMQHVQVLARPEAVPREAGSWSLRQPARFRLRSNALSSSMRKASWRPQNPTPSPWNHP